MPRMNQTSLPQPHEQRKVEELLVKLSTLKPISARPAPIFYGMSAIPEGCFTANPRVFHST